MDQGTDLRHVVLDEPGDHRCRGFRGETPTLPRHSDLPRNVGQGTVGGHRGLHRSDRSSVIQRSHDPVQPQLGPVCRAAGRQTSIPRAQLLERERVAAGELVHALVAQNVDHRVGVIRIERGERQPGRADRRGLHGHTPVCSPAITRPCRMRRGSSTTGREPSAGSRPASPPTPPGVQER